MIFEPVIICKDTLLSCIEFKGIEYVHIRKHKSFKDIEGVEGHYPTKKGVSFTPARWASFLSSIQAVDAKIRENEAGHNGQYKQHIGGGIFLTLDNRQINIRRFTISDGETDPIPSSCGICLSVHQWSNLKKGILALHHAKPYLKETTPCYRQEDHYEPALLRQCRECNPYENVQISF